MPGVELHAQVVNQLRRAAERGDKVTTSWSEPVETAWIFALVRFRCRHRIFRPQTHCSAGCLLRRRGHAGRDLLVRFYLRFLAAAEPAPGGNIAATAIITGYTRHLDRKDRETLMRLFSQHVSAAIAESMREHREQFMDGNDRVRKSSRPRCFSPICGIFPPWRKSSRRWR